MSGKNLLILLASLVVLIMILSTPLTDIARFGSSYLDAPSADIRLDVQEINDFLRVWSDFEQKGLNQSMKQVSLNQDSRIPPHIVRWLYAKGWNAEHFFAVEQHLRELVTIAALQNNLEDNKKLQEKGVANVRQIIDEQERQFAALKYNPQELALVRANFYQISNILEGKAVLK